GWKEASEWYVKHAENDNETSRFDPGRLSLTKNMEKPTKIRRGPSNF
ncbi:11776_t:CDS:2, partial [Dentiscutata erythropus]